MHPLPKPLELPKAIIRAAIEVARIMAKTTWTLRQSKAHPINKAPLLTAGNCWTSR